jgi:dihydroxyacetone kinase DhaKLM complex PTS-EIIA-like component DhaM
MAPLVAGSLTAAITLSDNATGAPQSIALNGTGITPAVASLTLSSTSLSFGGEPVGDSTVAQSVTVTNTSSVVLYFNSITLTGTNASSFVTSNTCGTNIAAGATCKIGVRMAPLVAGSLTAAITLSDNATGSPQSIALNGTGITPAVASLTLSSTSLSFGGEPVGDSTVAQSVTVTNTSAVVLYFNSITLTGADAASFVTSNTCGTNIAAGATCKIGVRMAPLVAGSLTAAITLSDNATGSPQSIVLSGTGN